MSVFLRIRKYEYNSIQFKNVLFQSLLSHKLIIPSCFIPQFIYRTIDIYTKGGSAHNLYEQGVLINSTLVTFPTSNLPRQTIGQVPTLEKAGTPPVRIGLLSPLHLPH